MKSFKLLIKISLIFLCITSIIIGCSKKKALLDPENPIHITVWHYYNSTQLIEFDRMVATFNKTKGREIGIFVTSISQGNVTELATVLSNTANGVLGVGELPNIFMAYPDSAYNIAKMGKAADLSTYMTQEEIKNYNTDFWSEGIINGIPTIFPIAKSTEVLYIDRLAWEKYAKSANIIADLADKVSTWESLVQTSKKYYEFTDSLTPDVLHDGCAFSGIDSISNYIIVGMKQQGFELMTSENDKGKVDINNEAMKKMWDNFVTPIARGYFTNIGRYRSDDMKTGLSISFVGSTTGSSYLPNEITEQDGTTHTSQIEIFPMPYMAGGEKYAIQQGGGMVVSKAEPAYEFASVEFLKWFTDLEQNVDFTLSSSYLPVMNSAYSTESSIEILNKMEQSDNIVTQNNAKMFKLTLEQLKTYKSYYSPAFQGRIDIRYKLDDLNKVATEARENVQKDLESGVEYEIAIEKHTGQAAFEKWLNAFKIDVENILRNP